ncbi:hypothetical protein QUF75_00965 [Desulfococcaceae bacterium HSG7]|nr:hypothetical protein [Desulfococcaceae bacterium HSG7]
MTDRSGRLLRCTWSQYGKRWKKVVTGAEIRHIQKQHLWIEQFRKMLKSLFHIKAVRLQGIGV